MNSTLQYSIESHLYTFHIVWHIQLYMSHSVCMNIVLVIDTCTA